MTWASSNPWSSTASNDEEHCRSGGRISTHSGNYNDTRAGCRLMNGTRLLVQVKEEAVQHVFILRTRNKYTSRWQVRWRQPRRSFLHDCSIYDQHLLRFCTTFTCDPIPGGAAACASTLAASPSPYPSRFLNLLRRRVRGTSKSIRAHFSSVAVGPASPTARAHPHDPVKVSNHFKLVSYIV
jgi:hypothetical protein